MSTDTPSLCRAALGELGTVFDTLDGAACERAVELIASAARIALYGVGREGLQVQGLAMRLYHLGLDAHVVGDMSCPPLGADDLLIVSAGPGTFSTVHALIEVAHSAGAQVLVFTAQPTGACAQAADAVVHVPAQTMADDQGARIAVLPMGSLYEGALYLLFEALVLALRERLVESPGSMRARHTNLE